jgi:hypothetical protein
MQISDENAALEGILENLHEWPVSGEEARRRVLVGVFVDDTKTDERFSRPGRAAEKNESTLAL